MYKPRILIADDETTICSVLKRVLEKEGYQVDICHDGDTAVKMASETFYDLLLTDLKMPGLDGLETLRKVSADSPETSVILMTNYSTVETAVEAMRLGARDYIIKPFIHDDIKISIKNALKDSRLTRENRLLKDELNRSLNLGEFIGSSEKIKDVFKLINKVARTDSSVLITGESGSGKELVARAIHRLSPRSKEPFVPVNCGALPAELLESELFGHTKGAFTGAVANKTGLFTEARGGAIFLDEIGELPIGLQVKLLRALQDREIRPVGSSKSFICDVRVITATNKQLEKEVELKAFREDLYYRINVLTIELPPLRERGNDVEELALHFFKMYAPKINKKVKTIMPSAMKLMRNYHWPGNVRELENVIERALILEEGDQLTPESLPENIIHPAAGAQSQAIDAQLSIDQYVKDFIIRYENIFKEKEIARMLGISRKSLWERRKKWGLERQSAKRNDL
ncbi:MAG TPA: sigma-54-dependent Fis family transcriptional regulator [Nitrospirae bacterium]|nr:sigma-54-dependent Fis family transcriptional regulator [Nitrospirota bacterium]